MRREAVRFGEQFAEAVVHFRRLERAESKPNAGHIPNGAVLAIMFAVIIFLVGLVSEQISALRFESRQ